MKINMEHHVPLGVKWQNQLWQIALLFFIGFIASMLIPSGINHAYQELFYMNGSIYEGAIMQDFASLLGKWHMFVVIVTIMMVAFAVDNYMSHSSGGSKSIYLMKRLPNRWELWRRCLTVPFLTVIAAILFWFLMIVLYYFYYVWKTPEACLAPDQWAKIWSLR